MRSVTPALATAAIESPPPMTVDPVHVRHRLRDRDRAARERVDLEHAHRPVPGDGLRPRDDRRGTSRSSSGRCRAPCDRRSPDRRRRASRPARPPRASARRRDRPAARSAGSAPAPAARPSRAASSRSSSTSDVPTGSPRALKKVYAIAPPMSSASTRGHEVLDHLELVGHLRAAEHRDERPIRVLQDPARGTRPRPPSAGPRPPL